MPNNNIANAATVQGFLARIIRAVLISCGIKLPDTFA